MTDAEEDKIRERAHALWLEEGQPVGREQEHWDRARREVEQADAGGGEAGEDRLDEAVEETFPASDPASETQPGGGITGPGT